jgi:DNA-binding Xre family transcriptional regulator
MKHTDLGRCLCAAQSDTGITSAYLAERLNVKPQQIARWRTCDNLKFHTIQSLCNALGMSLEEFLAYGGE